MANLTLSQDFVNLTEKIKRDLNITILPWVDRSGNNEETIIRFCLNRSNVDFLGTSRDLVEEYLVQRNVRRARAPRLVGGLQRLTGVIRTDQTLPWLAPTAFRLSRGRICPVQQQAVVDLYQHGGGRERRLAQRPPAGLGPQASPRCFVSQHQGHL